MGDQFCREGAAYSNIAIVGYKGWCELGGFWVRERRMLEVGLKRVIWLSLGDSLLCGKKMEDGKNQRSVRLSFELLLAAICRLKSLKEVK